MPVGGGGLASGVAIAVKSARPEVEVVGVRIADAALTIADGIAVKQPGELTQPLLREWLDGEVVVEDEDAAEAMVVLLERCKLVVEGAGAVGVAALLRGKVAPAPRGTTVAILSGGNVDAGPAALDRPPARDARRPAARRPQPRPGPARQARRAARLAWPRAGGNVVDVSHVREGFDLHVRETAVELVLETRGREHADAVMRAMREAGYPAQPLE